MNKMSKSDQVFGLFLILLTSLSLIAVLVVMNHNFLPKRDLPILVMVSPSIQIEEQKAIIEAIDYINQSLNMELFSTTDGNETLYIVNHFEVKNVPDIPVEFKAFALQEPFAVVLGNDFSKLPFKKLLIAHELLHSLGFPHQNKKHDSLLNEGPVWADKMSADIEYARSILSQLPAHDIELIKERYFQED